MVAEITAALNLGNAHESDSMESSEESDDETWGCVVEQERPQVGMKTPKSSPPPPPRKCINVHCHEEKEKHEKRDHPVKAGN